jgi:His/Glu/Gln/Arg/opine family amino acid ABC transporter permease subunit
MSKLPSWWFIAQGMAVTLQYTIFSVFGGLVIGISLAVALTGQWAAAKRCANIYISIFRGTPLLVQLLLVYYTTPVLVGYQISAFTSGVLAFSLNSGAYVAEVIRAGIQAVDRGQFEAAIALGIPRSLMMRSIILPQAVRNILPALVNEMINMLKESAIISVIGEADLMRRAQIVAAEQYRYFEPLMVAAICYYGLVVMLTALATGLERYLGRHDSR